MNNFESKSGLYTIMETN